MSTIKIIDLAENSPNIFHNSGSCIRNLPEGELNLQGGGLFKRHKPFKSSPPVVDVNPPYVVPDILIGFSVAFSI